MILGRLILRRAAGAVISVKGARFLRTRIFPEKEQEIVNERAKNLRAPH